MKKTYLKSREGFSLFFTMSFVVLMMILSGAVMLGASTHAKAALRQAWMEQAFMEAEGAAERAVQVLVNAGYADSLDATTVTYSNATATLTRVCPYVFNIRSEATVGGGSNGVTRVVEFGSVSPPSYALFARAATENGRIWDIPGDEFFGEVYWGDAPKIRTYGPDEDETPIYWENAYTAEDHIDGTINDHTFQSASGLEYNTTRVDPNRDIDWDDLKASAQSFGDVYQGNTSIKFNGSEMLVSNEIRYGDTNYHSRSVGSEDDIIYVEEDPNVVYDSNNELKLTVEKNGAGNEVDGQITIVSEGDVHIKDHIRYSNDPTIDSSSDDVLGVISRDDISIRESAPDDLDLYGAFISAGVNGGVGKFSYKKWSRGPLKGNLNLLGSLVQDKRGHVGRFNWATGAMRSGYSKNFIYDVRFKRADANGCRFAPPFFPATLSEVEINEWRDS